MKSLLQTIVVVLGITLMSGYGVSYASDKADQLDGIINSPAPSPYIGGVNMYPAVGSKGEALVCILMDYPADTAGFCLSVDELTPILGLAMQATQRAKDLSAEPSI